MSERVFALTGLTSRGGLANWVFFFFPERLVMIDVGLTPALKAGVEAGLLGGVGESYGPQSRPSQELEAWYEQLRAKARKVVELPDDRIRGVRLHLRASAHQLFVAGPDGAPQRFALMNRREADAAADALSRRLGARFETSTSAVFAFFKRHAPFLMK